MKASRVCVLGTSGGIGAALVDRLAEARCETVYAGARAPRPGVAPNVRPFASTYSMKRAWPRRLTASWPTARST